MFKIEKIVAGNEYDTAIATDGTQYVIVKNQEAFEGKEVEMDSKGKLTEAKHTAIPKRTK